MSKELIKQNRDLPVVMEELRREIASATSFDFLKEIKNKAKAWEAYYKASGYGLEAQNLGAEMKIRAERKMGELLPDIVKQGRPKRLQDETFLEDLGINKTQMGELLPKLVSAGNPQLLQSETILAFISK